MSLAHVLEIVVWSVGPWSVAGVCLWLVLS